MTKFLSKLGPLVLSLSLIVFGTFSLTNFAMAADNSSVSQEQSLRDQLNAASRAADAKMQEAQTLQNEIAILDASIVQIEASMAITDNNISETQAEINTTQNQIAQKTAELNQEKENLAETLRVMYETPDRSAVEVVVGSNSLSEIVNKEQNIQSVESQIETSVNEITKLKTDLEDQRKNLEKKKAEFSDLKAQQQAQIQGLNDQKAQKAQMMESTLDTQKLYANQVSAARASLALLNAQLANLGNRVSYGHVNSGDVIGYEGSTGFSTGPHVHFEVRKDGIAINPRNFLGSTLGWPLVDFHVTQEYGPASWTSWYSFHTGIDLASNSGYGAPIRAAASGEIILHQYYGGYGSCVIIDHGNGLLTLYGHMIN